MQKADKSKQPWRNLIILITLLIIVTGDILTKKLDPFLTLLMDRPFINGVSYELSHITNTGSAFGAFQGYALALAIVGASSVCSYYLGAGLRGIFIFFYFL